MKTNINLKNILLNKWKEKKLSHFYILTSSKLSTEDESKKRLKDWINDFIFQTITISKNIKSADSTSKELLLGHPDILIIDGTDLKSKEYLVEDFDDFFRFLGYKHFELPWKFIVIFDPHLLSKIVFNKLLKSLEEPAKDTTIFLVNHQEKNFISTIESRAIKLNPFCNEESLAQNDIFFTHDSFESWLIKTLPSFMESPYYSSLAKKIQPEWKMSDYLEFLKNNKEFQHPFRNLYLIWESNFIGNFATKSEAIKNLSWFDISATFNNSYSERFISLINSPINDDK